MIDTLRRYLMNEYIRMCKWAEARGEAWVHGVAKKTENPHLVYVNEKLNILFR